MSGATELALIEETALGLLGAPTPDATFDTAAWALLEDSGLSLVGIAEEDGGAGGGLAVAAVVARAAARSASMLPVAETALLGGWMLAGAGHAIPRGPLTACTLADGALVASASGYELSGRAGSVPWARVAERVAVLVDGMVVSVDPARAVVVPGENLAGEPRDDLIFERAPLAEGEVRAAGALCPNDVLRRGALLRALGIVGAIDAATRLTFDFVRSRQQFGRPLSAFQAVQQLVAELAAEAAATAIAVDAAVEGETHVRVAAAKTQAGRGATVAARITHQLHGAIGVTHECSLHLFTRRLWSWRDEYGSETFWANELGRAAAARGGDGLWSFLADDEVTQ